MTQPFLFEIGCEEIPARMIAAAAEDLRARLVGVLHAAGVAHGDSRAWGGTRRLAVRVGVRRAAFAIVLLRVHGARRRLRRGLFRLAAGVVPAHASVVERGRGEFDPPAGPDGPGRGQ